MSVLEFEAPVINAAKMLTEDTSVIVTKAISNTGGMQADAEVLKVLLPFCFVAIIIRP